VLENLCLTKGRPKYVLLDSTIYSLIQNSTLKKIIFFIPIVAIFLIVVTKLLFGVNNEIYYLITIEDGPIENATAIAYFISFIFSVLICGYFKQRKKFFVLFLILGAGFLFVGLEEISWGQRIFDFSPPDWFPTNTQGETTIHNLTSLIQYRHASFMVVAFIGSFTWFILPKIYNRFFKIPGKNYKTFLRYAVPSKYLISYFFPIFLLWLIWDLSPRDFSIKDDIRWNFFVWYDSEPLELLLAIGILLFVLCSYIKLREDFSKISK